jgi:plasmid stability protein
MPKITNTLAPSESTATSAAYRWLGGWDFMSVVHGTVSESVANRLRNSSKGCKMHAMATSITIRNVPDETRDELAARAARSGRSLQEYLRGTLIDLVAKPDINELMDRVSARKRITGIELTTEQILGHREADRP